MNVSLRAVAKDNFAAVIDLPLLAHLDYLASNACSIAQARFHPHHTPRAIYATADRESGEMYAKDELPTRVTAILAPCLPY
jgi:hypothetical protein